MAGLVFVGADSLTKVLVAEVPVVDVIWGRHISYLLAVVVIAGRGRPGRLLITANPRIQLLRGLMMFASTATFFFGLSLLPLAEVSTLGSISPLIVVLLAGPFLGERVTAAAGLGALIGFAGVVALVGLDPTHLNLAVLVPLTTAVTFALFSMLTRALRGDAPEVTLFYSGVIGLVGGTVLMLVMPGATTPDPLQWLGIGVVGLAALTGHRLLVAAYRWGRASDLAPLGYLSLVWAFIVGAVVFAEPVQATAILGATLITAGGVIAVRSSRVEEEAVPQVLVDYGDAVDHSMSPR